MAGFKSHKAKPDDPGTRDPNAMSFRELLCAIFGQDVSASYFSIPGIPDNGGEWIDKFVKGPRSNLTTLNAGLPLAGAPLKNINVKRNLITTELAQQNGLDYMFMQAFAIAVLARSCEHMRTGGVNIVGNTDTEKAIMYAAAKMAGLSVKNADRKMESNAAAAMQQAKANDLWQRFAEAIRECPNNDDKKPPPPPPPAAAASPVTPPAGASGPQPKKAVIDNKAPAVANADSEPEQRKSLSPVFNRAVPDDIKNMLGPSGVDEGVYKDIRDGIVKDQDARRDTLRSKYKDAFNLTHSQLDDIIKAMDNEGITSLEKGNRRVINFDANGQPKGPKPS